MRPGIIFILLLSIFIVDSSVYDLIVPTTLRLLDINVAKNAIANYEFISMLSPAYLLAVPVFTICSDKWGRKNILISCLCLSVIAYGVLSVASVIDSMLLVLFAIVLLDLTSAELPIVLAFIADITQGRQKFYYFVLIGFIVFNDLPLVKLGNYISSLKQYPWMNTTNIALTALGIALLNLTLCARFLPKSPAMLLKKHYKNQRVTLEEIISAFSSLWTSRCIRPYSLTLIMLQFVNCLYSQNIANYIARIAGFSSDDLNAFILYTYIVVFLVLVVLYPVLMRYISTRKLMLICIFLCTAGMLTNLLFPSRMVSPWISAFFIYPQITLIMPLLWIVLSDVTDKWHQGILMGVIYVSWSFLSTISGILINFLNTFSLYYVPIITILLLLAAVIPLFRYRNRYETVTDLPPAPPNPL